MLFAMLHVSCCSVSCSRVLRGAISCGVLAALVARLGAAVAFNDCVPGLGTGSNVTTYAPGQSGYLRDFASGATLPIAVTVRSSNLITSTVQGRPDYGSPASIVFDGVVDFAGFPNPSLELANNSSLTYTFSGLNPASEYNFQGTAIRGNLSYGSNRWSLFEITNALSFTSQHSAGALTSAQSSLIGPSQAAIATGDNAQGMLAWW